MLLASCAACVASNSILHAQDHQIIQEVVLSLSEGSIIDDETSTFAGRIYDLSKIIKWSNIPMKL